jgi:hypothetical protein
LKCLSRRNVLLTIATAVGAMAVGSLERGRADGQDDALVGMGHGCAEIRCAADEDALRIEDSSLTPRQPTQVMSGALNTGAVGTAFLQRRSHSFIEASTHTGLRGNQSQPAPCPL